MRYSRSADGKLRTSVRVILRFDREDIAAIRRKLREGGHRADDKAIRRFIESCVDDSAVAAHWQDDNEHEEN